MSAVAEKLISVRAGAATIMVPERLAALAYIEKLAEEARPLPVQLSSAAPQLPAIGADYYHGKYAGVTIFDNSPAALILLPGELEEASWKKAKDWCAEQGGELPMRFDHLVLWTNLRAEFKLEAYWTGEEVADDPGYAWYQTFRNGYQSWGHKSSRLRVVAVRRVPIQPFQLSEAA